jgi:hypothetical protein
MHARQVLYHFSYIPSPLTTLLLPTFSLHDLCSMCVCLSVCPFVFLSLLITVCLHLLSLLTNGIPSSPSWKPFHILAKYTYQSLRDILSLCRCPSSHPHCIEKVHCLRSGCHNTMPQTGCLKQQRFIFLHSGGWRSKLRVLSF